MINKNNFFQTAAFPSLSVPMSFALKALAGFDVGDLYVGCHRDEFVGQEGQESVFTSDSFS